MIARNVICQQMGIEAMSLAMDETRVALRFLERVPDKFISQQIQFGTEEELKTTKKLFDGFALPQQFFSIGENNYAIFAEAILDKNSSEYRKMCFPGVHLVFHWHPTTGIQIDPKGALSWFTGRNTAELIRHMGGLWYFDLWIRNPDAPLTECARSITTSPSTILVTNLDDLGEKWSAEDVMKGGQSKWLNLAYRLTARKTETAYVFTFEVLDGKTHNLAKDITWDGYIIEAVDGYVPHRQLEVTNGIGEFKAFPLMLNKGEPMRIRVNGPFCRSLAECTVIV